MGRQFSWQLLIMLQKNNGIEFKLVPQFCDQGWVGFKDKISLVRRVDMAGAVSQGALVHFLHLLDFSTLFDEVGFEAFDNLFDAIFLALAIDGHQAFITMFHISVGSARL